MIEALVVTFFPVAFLAVLFTGGQLLRRRQIDPDGDAPIGRKLFYASKYLIIVVWAAMVLDSWGVSVSFFNAPASLKRLAVGVWALGFVLLFIGRFGLGSSFRIGSPRGEHALESGRIVPCQPQPDVPGRVFHPSCHSPPHLESSSAPGRRLHSRRSPQDCPCRRDSPSVRVWRRVRRVLQSGETVSLELRLLPISLRAAD